MIPVHITLMVLLLVGVVISSRRGAVSWTIGFSLAFAIQAVQLAWAVDP